MLWTIVHPTEGTTQIDADTPVEAWRQWKNARPSVGREPITITPTQPKETE